MKKRNVYILIIMFIMFLNIGVYAEETCEGLFGSKLINDVMEVLNIIRIVVPVLLILLTSIDFAKVVFSDSKDGMNKAKNNFVKRAVAALIIFFAPNIVEIILKLVDLSTGCVSAVK